MNNYEPGDIIEIMQLYQNSDTLYWELIKSIQGLLIEEIDNDLLCVLVNGKKEVHDIGYTPYLKFKVEVISEGNENGKG